MGKTGQLARPGCAGISGSIGFSPLPPRADPPVSRRQRTNRAACTQSGARPARLSSGDHLQTRSRPVPPRSPQSRRGCTGAAWCDARSSRTGQPLQIRAAGGSGTCAPCAARSAGLDRGKRSGTSWSGESRKASSDARQRRTMEKQSAMGRRVPSVSLPTYLTSSSSRCPETLGCRQAPRSSLLNCSINSARTQQIRGPRPGLSGPMAGSLRCRASASPGRRW